jgi:hypothetical protein
MNILTVGSRVSWRNAAIACAFATAALVAVAVETFEVEYGGVGGGGGTSSGGDFVLTGGIGGIGDGRSAGGAFTLEGGSLAMFMVVQTAGAPRLTLTRSGDDVIISWPVTAIGFGLEQTGDLTTPAWGGTGLTPVVVGEAYQVTVPANSSSKFFRLLNAP